MATNSFVLGEVYFRVTYPDPQMRYPTVESFVFLGKNLSDEDAGETWYFQPASDFGRYGSALDPGVQARPVVCAMAAEAVDMIDMDRLIETLQSCARRRNFRKAE